MKFVLRFLSVLFLAHLVSATTLWPTGLSIASRGATTQPLRAPTLFPLPSDGSLIVQSGAFPAFPQSFGIVIPVSPPPFVPPVPVPLPAVTTPPAVPVPAVTTPPAVPLPGAFGLLASALVLLIGRGAAPFFRRRFCW